MRIGILTSGGDCPGINATIRGVSKTAICEWGMEVIGIHSGFQGLLTGDVEQLTEKSLSGLLNLGGTVLGTSREKPFKKNGGTVDGVDKPTLIRRNKAMILDDPQTLIEELGLPDRKSKIQPGRQSEIPLSVVPETAAPPTPNRNGASPQWEGLPEEGKKVARMLSGVEKMHLDELCTALDMPVQNLTVLLLEMELAGAIETLPGKYYALSPQARK